jgi:hypothetical protein
LFHDDLDLFIEQDLFQIMTILQQTLEGSSLLWVCVSRHSAFIGMMLGGLGFGAIKRSLRKKTGVIESKEEVRKKSENKSWVVSYQKVIK